MPSKIYTTVGFVCLTSALTACGPAPNHRTESSGQQLHGDGAIDSSSPSTSDPGGTGSSVTPPTGAGQFLAPATLKGNGVFAFAAGASRLYATCRGCTEVDVLELKGGTSVDKLTLTTPVSANLRSMGVLPSAMLIVGLEATGPNGLGVWDFSKATGPTGPTFPFQLPAANGSVSAMAVSYDGLHLAVADGTDVIILNTGTFAVEQTLSQVMQMRIDFLEFSDDGKRLAVAGGEGDKIAFALFDGASFAKITDLDAAKVKGDKVGSISISRDNASLATVSVGDKAQVQIWDASTGQFSRAMPAPVFFNAAVYLTESDGLVTSGGDGLTSYRQYKADTRTLVNPVVGRWIFFRSLQHTPVVGYEPVTGAVQIINNL